MVHFRAENRIRSVKAQRLAIATGAMERPAPLPGWTLPGVMGAGAAQVLLKTERMAPTGRVVLAGKGPLLLLLAAQLQEAGVAIHAFIETTTAASRAGAMLRHPAALAALDYLVRGIGFYRKLRQGGAAVFEGAREIRIVGTDRVESVRFVTGGREREVAADHLFVHEGVVPNVQLTRHLGCAHDWHMVQRYWHARTDAWGNTSRDGVVVAGDGAGIAGARLAEYGGRLAAVDTAYRLGRISRGERDSRTRTLRNQSRRHRWVRPFLDDLYRPPLRTLAAPRSDTIVCRCENVTAGVIANAAENGIHDPNRLKFATRCGMGPCQSRMCALSVTEIIAAGANLAVEDIGYFRIRPPVKPVGLGDLAAWGRNENGTDAAT